MKMLIKPHQYWLFYLCKADVRLYRLVGDSLRLYTIWQRTNPEQFASFQTFAITLSGLPVLVMIESEDQIIQQEKIPYLLGWDRFALIDRKLGVMGQGADKTLAYFISLGRGRGRNEDKQESLILIAAADSADYLPWLMVLRQAKAHIVAVTTDLLITSSTAKAAGNNENLALHVSWNRGGLVQTVLDKGYPLLARFCPWPSNVWSETTGWSEAVGQDITITQTQKLLSYLQGRGLWSTSLRTPLTVVLPATVQPATLTWPVMSGITWQTVNAPVQLLTVHEGLNPVDAHTCLGAESLAISQMVSLAKNIYQIAPRNLRARHLNWLYMRYTWRVVGLLVGLLSMAGIYYGVAWAYHAWQNQNINNFYENTQRQYLAKRASFPKIGVSNEHLRDVVTLASATQQCFPGLPEFLLKISQMNTHHPTIELIGISWNNQLVPIEGAYSKFDNTALQCVEKYSLIGAVNARSQQSQRDIQKLFEAWLTDISTLSEESKVKVSIKTPPLDLTQGKYSENSPSPTKASFAVDLDLNQKITPPR